MAWQVDRERPRKTGLSPQLADSRRWGGRGRAQAGF